ncbi:hypothetical protein M9H77_31293 [Catharanthus roseus]|uniref:Uncharacterized protein n=1 Tax=Catharanthus roseus TaxID=4058 RepID=A0ACC0A3K7_CATRO|nr:hypothetical protein M9H77_31293 [Catharanthus roseus]
MTGGKSLHIPKGPSGVAGGKKRLKKSETIWQQIGPTLGSPQEPDMILSYNRHIAAAIWCGQVNLQYSYVLFDFIMHV